MCLQLWTAKLLYIFQLMLFRAFFISLLFFLNKIPYPQPYLTSEKLETILGYAPKYVRWIKVSHWFIFFIPHKRSFLKSTVNNSMYSSQSAKSGGGGISPFSHICHKALTFKWSPFGVTKTSCCNFSEWTNFIPFTLCFGLPLPSLWKDIGKIIPA